MAGLKSLYEVGMATHAGLAKAFGAGRALPPAQLFLEVTDRCNLDCRMCFYRGTLGAATAPLPPDPDHLSVDELMDVVEALPTARLVSISGGEPFARADLPELLERLAAKRLVTVETNGTLIGEEGARAVARLGSPGLPRAGMVAVDFSILGPRAVHDAVVRGPGSFDLAIAALRALRDERDRLGRAFPKITLKSAVLRENLGVLEELADIAHDERVDYFVLKEEDPGKVSLDPASNGGTMARGSGTKAIRPDEVEGLADRIAALMRPRGGVTESFLIPLALSPRQLEDHVRRAVSIQGARCAHPWSRIGVLPRGEVYSCKLFSTRSVRDTPIRTIWNGPEFRSFRRDLDRAGAFEDCVGCCFLELASA